MKQSTDFIFVDFDFIIDDIHCKNSFSRMIEAKGVNCGEEIGHQCQLLFYKVIAVKRRKNWNYFSQVGK